MTPMEAVEECAKIAESEIYEAHEHGETDFTILRHRIGHAIRQVKVYVRSAQMMEHDPPKVALADRSGDQALVSIAVSLKRIADTFEGDKSQGTFFEQADGWFNHWLGTWIRSR